MLKDQHSKTSRLKFDDWLFEPEKCSRNFQETGLSTNNNIDLWGVVLLMWQNLFFKMCKLIIIGSIDTGSNIYYLCDFIRLSVEAHFILDECQCNSNIIEIFFSLNL